MQPDSLSDCWRNNRNAQALSLPLLHENRTLFLSLHRNIRELEPAIGISKEGAIARIADVAMRAIARCSDWSD
jgi:hypothetical protein